MPIVRLVDSDGWGITVVEVAAAPPRIKRTLNKLQNLDDAITFLKSEGWTEIPGGRGNGDNTEFIFTRDHYPRK